ncbi:MAG: hypothetical protein QF752_07570 [Planctomycetota bacterium]|jgi:hypothetical protein|nr:hypothetical protein [Planctomycetota bacterium]
MEEPAGVKDFCRIALEKGLASPDEVEACVTDYMRAIRAGKEISLGQLFMDREYLSRREVIEVMRTLYPDDWLTPTQRRERSEEEIPSPKSSPKKISPPTSTKTVQQKVAPSPSDAKSSRPAVRHSAPTSKPDDRSKFSNPPTKKTPRPTIEEDRTIKNPPSLGNLAEVARNHKSLMRRINVICILLPFMIAVGIFFGNLSIRGWDTIRLPALPKIILERDLEPLIQLDGVRWAHDTSNNRLFLLIEYRNLDSQALPPRIEAVGVAQKRILERVTVRLYNDFNSIRSLATRLDSKWLQRGALMDPERGFLLVAFVVPREIESVILLGS